MRRTDEQSLNRNYSSLDNILLPERPAPMNQQWTVVATPQRKERYAQLNLERQGFAVYCPMVRKRIKHARSESEVLRPLFPGYLFVQVCQEAASWRPILSTAGVRALILSGKKPVSADRLVCALKAREGASATADGGQEQNLGAILKGLDADARLAPLKNMLATAVR
jgi:transcriptional antiterminator RfaH